MAHAQINGAGKRGRPGYDRESLLTVAVATFNERGYDGTGMEELSRRLGISKSAIYHHVSGKEELLRLAVDRALDALFALLEEPRATNGAPLERLEYVVRRSVEVLGAQLPYVTLLLRVRGNTPTERRALERRREFDHRVAALVARAADDGDVRADVDPHLASRLLFGTVNSLIEWYHTEGGLSVDQIADALVAMVFDGLRARGV